ncbi:MAG: PDDEXK nuclease domain-containing protein, partial [Thermodesulfobacteriota bacterium]|nr:PDDEXK nuclease domain-containing protein [Thermodesulfobacteriota bacterium]
SQHISSQKIAQLRLKLGKFKAAHKGQMELYLRWLEKYEKEPDEETPLGLILCAGKTNEQIELLQLNKSGIKVAEYMTELPKRELLEQKLHKAVELARKWLEAKPA